MPLIDLNEMREGLMKEMEYKTKKGKGGAKPEKYIDARQVMDRLDDVVGMENWQSEYYELKSNLYCKIGIQIDNQWIWKSDVGVESNFAAVKGEASDAFKRAGVRWGIGRFLYEDEVAEDKPKATYAAVSSEPSVKQIDYMKSLHLEYKKVMTKAEVTKLISDKKEAQDKYRANNDIPQGPDTDLDGCVLSQ